MANFLLECFFPSILSNFEFSSQFLLSSSEDSCSFFNFNLSIQAPIKLILLLKLYYFTDLSDGCCIFAHLNLFLTNGGCMAI